VPVRRLDSLDDQPQRERNFENEHRHPHKKGHVDKSDEPQGKSYQKQERSEYAEPRFRLAYVLRLEMVPFLERTLE
jgi:hypothetical protein